MSSKNRFLARVHHNVALGNQAGRIPSLPARDGVGHQGAGNDPVQRFCDELAAVGGFAHVAADAIDAAKKILGIVSKKQVQYVFLGAGPFLDALELLPLLQNSGCEVLLACNADPPGKQELFRADVGISAVEHLVAETGTIVVASKPNDPRSVSLLPPVHIAVASEKQILPDLFDLFETLKPTENGTLPSGISLITGPSKTGDIELTLVTGVHGPGEVHVIIVMN